MLLSESALSFTPSGPQFDSAWGHINSVLRKDYILNFLSKNMEIEIDYNPYYPLNKFSIICILNNTN